MGQGGIGRTVGRALVAAAVAVAVAVAVGWSSPASGRTGQEAGSALERDVRALASDEMGGRAPGTPGWQRAQDYIIDRLDDFSEGLDAGSGADAFTQEIGDRVNIVAVIPGDELADEFVVLGAHYDHLGSCATAIPGDDICNGATDNAAGVAAVLSIGERIAEQGGGPRRSVVLAFWDAEEAGLVGSRLFVENPMIPLEQTVAYLNFDIQGAELLPSLRSTTFAIASETGGDRLVSAVRNATAGGPLDTHLLSSIFGQGRSDYVNFIQAGVPTVFFSDATGPCYHTAQDDIGIVDVEKLGHQVDNAHALTEDLVDGDDVPAFVPDAPLATFDDAVEVRAVADRALADIDLFPRDQRNMLLEFDQALADIVAAGPDAFGDDDVATLLAGSANAIAAFADLPCVDVPVPPPGGAAPAQPVAAAPAFTG